MNVSKYSDLEGSLNKFKRVISSNSEYISSEIGQTPRTSVWKKNKSTLWYYSAKKKKYKTPLFLVYSLINKPYILDLTPGSSMIHAFTEEGYDVYLLDFGYLGYEDKDQTLDDYIKKHIQRGVRRALQHSKGEEITIIGFCLGGTLAAIYTAIASEPVRNLVLFAPPLDFKKSPLFNKWHKALQTKELKLDGLLNEYNFISAQMVRAGLKLMTAPFSYNSYLNLLQRADDENYIKKWRCFNQWVNDHVPFSGATLKQLVNDLVIDNKLINNQLIIDKEKVKLSNIKSNLLVISTMDDQIVPETMIKPFLTKVKSKDKLYKRVKGGHVTLAVRGALPDFLIDWLQERSSPFHG